MKKGFTLLELLAVIVLLAVITMITTPVILKEIKSSKEKAFIQSAYSLVQASTTYQANNNYKAYTFNFADESTGYKNLEIDGDYPSSGTLTIDENGKVNLTLWSDDLSICISKEKDTKEIKKTNYSKDECK